MVQVHLGEVSRRRVKKIMELVQYWIFMGP